MKPVTVARTAGSPSVQTWMYFQADANAVTLVGSASSGRINVLVKCAPKGGPRSVPDPAGERYDEMIRQERLKRERAEAAVARPSVNSVGHPGFAESLTPVWGSGREVVADFQEGDYAGAALNGALAASDLFLAGSIAKGVAKGGVYVARNAAKKAPYGWRREVRPWMGKQGYLEKGQHGHHWATPQNGWGKSAPDWVKNQPWNIKAMPEEPVGAEIHGRLTGSYKGKPQFNAVERYVHGTPTWSKVGTGAAVGHPAAAAKAQSDKRR